MAQKMLGVRQEDVLGKKMNEIDSPLAAELANVPKGETATVRLNDSNIYRCTHSSLLTVDFSTLLPDRKSDGRSDEGREESLREGDPHDCP